MGTTISGLFGGNTGRTDDPDPVTGITSRDRYLIQSSFVLIRKDLTKTGVNLLIKLFEKYPEEHDRFPFRDVPLSDLRENKKFRAHCGSVMYSLCQIIDNLDDSELLISILTKIGDNHNKHKVPATSFWHVKEALLTILKDVVSKEAMDAWDRTVQTAFSVVGKQL